MSQWFTNIIALVVLSFLVGCTGVAGPKVKAVPEKEPVSIAQIAMIDDGTDPNAVLQILGKPNQVIVEKYNTAWIYNVHDEQLASDTTFQYSIYSSQVYGPTTSLQTLPYKEKDVLRDKYYTYKDKYNEAVKERFEASIENIGARGRKEEMLQEKILRYEEQANKYEDKLLDLKEQLLKERGSLPVWFVE